MDADNAPRAATSAGLGSAEHFDEVAKSWIRRYSDRPSFRHRITMVGAVVREVVAYYETPVVLDFGGGPGIFSLVASERASTVVCLDASAPMIRAGHEQEGAAAAVVRTTGHEPRPERVHRVVGTLEALGVGVAPTFDAVLAIAVLEYVPDPGLTLTQLAARLRPGGRLLLTVPNERSWYRWAEGLVGSFGSSAGGVLRSERLRSRSYASIRPHGNHVPWRSGADAGGLRLERIAPLALAASGIMAYVTPSQIVVLQKGR